VAEPFGSAFMMPGTLARETRGMASQRVGMLIFPRLTQLDMTGPYEVLARFAQHVGGELFKLMSDVKMVHVP
jgi:hypothetical protein